MCIQLRLDVALSSGKPRRLLGSWEVGRAFSQAADPQPVDQLVQQAEWGARARRRQP